MVVRRRRECEERDAADNGDDAGCFADVGGDVVGGEAVEGEGLQR